MLEKGYFVIFCILDLAREEGKKLKKVLNAVDIQQLFVITLGTLSMTIGLYFFMVPDSLVGGGTGGMAQVLAPFIPLPYSVILFAINIILLVIGIVVIGKEFGGTTLYSVILYSGFYALFERFVPISGSLADDPLVNLILGQVLLSTGVGLVFNAGATTGGVDIIAKIMNMYLPVTFATGVMISDLTILLANMLVFGIERGLYATIGVLLGNVVIDRVITGGSARYNVNITSEISGQINDFILTDIGRATTIYSAKGGYTKRARAVITTVVDREELLRLKNFVTEIDSNAFMYVSPVSEVTGRGFSFEVRPKQSRIAKIRERALKGKEVNNNKN
ncbi:YitT family protein [Aerococcus viridans]|uniref:YitT family protein n=1 Tax=Aerococcus viridans TaxID=1377 RepID=A0A2N6UDT1_9LACT|nr:YitT family protein [Aerococcus viridans]